MEFLCENSWVWAVGLPAAGILLLWLAYRYRIQGCAWRQIVSLIGLRFLTFLILLLVASHFTRIDPDRKEPKRDRVVLLIDRSESMSLEDKKETRYREAVGFARNRLLPALHSAKIGVELAMFAEDVQDADGPRIAGASPDGKQTNLARAIARTLVQREPPPLGVVALTDGATNETSERTRAISALVENRVPFVGIGFGNQVGTRVLTIEELVAPPAAAPNQEFHVSARLRTTGETKLPDFQLVLLRDQRLVEQRTIAVESGARVWQEGFSVRETEEGLHRYTIGLLLPPDPSIKCPNSEASAAVRIVGEKRLRVLFVQGGLTWDYKFIRMALQGDPAIRLTGLSRTASQSTFLQTVEDDADLVNGFPTSIERLASYRVVALSNLRARDLTEAQQDLLARFCRELGGGVLMIGGADSFDASWQDSALEQLLPVRFSPFARRSSGSQSFRLQLTADALAHPVFQITDAGNNRAAWSQLPTFSHFATVASVKSGARIWAVRPFTTGSSDSPVLMASQRYGAGRSAVICVQNFWRWRLAKESNTQHFDRFWRQLFRYLAEGSRDSVLLRLADQQLQPGTDIRVVLQRRPTSSDTEDATDSYRFRVTDQAGHVAADQSVELKTGQTVETTFRVESPGLYQITVSDQHGSVLASRSSEIRTVDNEFLHTSRNMDTLRQWAAISDGMAVASEECDDLEELVDHLKTSAEQPKRPTHVHRPVGVNGWVLGLLLGCLSTEWLLRRRWGLT